MMLLHRVTAAKCVNCCRLIDPTGFIWGLQAAAKSYLREFHFSCYNDNRHFKNYVPGENDAIWSQQFGKDSMQIITYWDTTQRFYHLGPYF